MPGLSSTFAAIGSCEHYYFTINFKKINKEKDKFSTYL